MKEGRYELAFAQTPEEIDAVLRLRFEVFNLEMGEGLDASYLTGRDEDAFDSVCHHMIVRETQTQEIVGSYRMQTAELAAKNLGFYSDTEYDVSDLPASVLAEAVEIGRACVAKPHRGVRTLFLLWKGLGLYLSSNQKRYLFGCSSVKTQDSSVARGLHRYLAREDHLHPSIHVQSRTDYRCDLEGPVDDTDGEALPDLFRIYLHHGAKICGPPAIDRQFKTIDFLMLFDVYDMPSRMIKNFLR